MTEKTKQELDEEKYKRMDDAFRKLITLNISEDMKHVEKIRDILLERYREKLNAVKDGDVFILDGNDSEINEILEKTGSRFLYIARQGFFEAQQKLHPGKFAEILFQGCKLKVSREKTLRLQELTPKHYGRPVTFNCTVMALGERKVFITAARVYCKRCGDDLVIKADENRDLDIPLCVTASCKRRPMEIDKNACYVRYVQNVLLQEPLEEAKNNSPVIFAAKLEGFDVGAAFMGQKKKITGVFKMEYKDNKKEQDIFIDVISMEDMEDIKLCMPSEEEMKKYISDCAKPTFFDDVAMSYAPHIYGHTMVKKSLILTLSSSLERTNDKRGWINIFLMGDPSMAKSELLKFANKIVTKSIYTTGKGSTGAGLTAGMVKLPDGTSALMAGVYPLCNNGMAIIDEFDKMSKEDQGVMHEVMEQGTVSRAVSGKQVTLPAMAGTIAAANPKFGTYDITVGLADNIDLPSPILSRFDMIWLIKDKVDNVMDTHKAKHVITTFRGETPREPYMTPQQLSSYLNYVRTLRPTLSEEAGVKLLSLYNTLREESKRISAIPIGIRQLEALVRLTLAHARLKLKDVADESDVESVLDILKESFKSLGTKIETSVQGSLVPKKLGKEQQFVQAVTEVKDKDNLFKQKDVFDVLETKFGWDEIEFKKMFQQFRTSSNILDRGGNRWLWV